MAHIFPFNGILYNQEKIQNLSLVTAPPYDVISEEEQTRYYGTHKYNIIRLILGKEGSEDRLEDNRYTRSACFLQEWGHEKVLIKDDEPSIYFYSQEYSFSGKKKIQKGFICILRLEDFSKDSAILPHEETLAKPKNDRLKLLEACHANLSPIFGLYSDPDFHLETLLRRHMSKPQIINIKDENETIHKFWRVQNPDTIREIQETLLTQKLYIADGHHRYETALAYKNNRRLREQNFTGSETYNHIMIYLTNMDADGLTILPAHRMVRHIPRGKSDVWEKRMDEFFTRKECSSYEEISKLMKAAHNGETVIGMYYEGKFQLLTMKDDGKYEKAVANKLFSPVHKSLDVTVVHSLLLDYILNSGKKMAESNIVYEKDVKKALKSVDDSKFALVVLLNPTRVEQVKAIASVGKKMPGKATYFYPKPLSGLVIHKF